MNIAHPKHYDISSYICIVLCVCMYLHTHCVKRTKPEYFVQNKLIALSELRTKQNYAVESKNTGSRTLYNANWL